MGAGGVAAATAAISALGGVFANQGRSPASQTPRHVDTSTAAIAGARDKKERKALLKNAREERLVGILTDPQVMGALVVVGGLMASSHLPFHQDPATNARIRGLAGASCVLMGLGRAGVGDLTSIGVAAMAAAALGLPGGGFDQDGGSGRWPATLYVPGIDWPVASAFGPIPLLQRLMNEVV